MNSSGLAPPHIPQALLRPLLQAPALLAALRSIIAGAGASNPASEDPPPLPLPPCPFRPSSSPCLLMLLCRIENVYASCNM